MLKLLLMILILVTSCGREDDGMLPVLLPINTPEEILIDTLTLERQIEELELIQQ